MNFKVIDVETANSDYSSICQIGLLTIVDGNIKEEWETLVNPESYFDPFNVSIHGIDKKKVKNAPTFDEIHEKLNSLLKGEIVIHHGHFDRVALNRVCYEYDIEAIDANWLDSTKIVRRTWEQFSKRGYGLKNISEYLGIDFKHHDALEDSRAAFFIVKEASKITGNSIQDWLIRVNQPITNPDINVNRKIKGNPEGDLYGEVIVFTGQLNLSRAEASKIASEQGCTVATSVSKKTTKLVVGLQDDSKLNGYKKSTKHRKAEEIIKAGGDIEILSEKDFINLCNIVLPTNNTSIQSRKSVSKKNKRAVSFSISLEGLLHEEVEYDKKTDINRGDKRKLADWIDENLSALEFNSSIEDELLSEIEVELYEIKYLLNVFRKGRVHVEDFKDELSDNISNIEDLLVDLSEDSSGLRGKINGVINEIKKIL